MATGGGGELPARLTRGQVLTADWLNRLLEAVRARTVGAGVGVRVTRTPAGTSVALASAPRTANADEPTDLCVIGTVVGDTEIVNSGTISVEVNGENRTAYYVASSGYTYLKKGDAVLLHPCQFAVAAEDSEGL